MKDQFDDLAFAFDERVLTRTEGEALLASLSRRLGETSGLDFEHVLDVGGSTFATSELRGLLHARAPSGGPFAYVVAGIVAATEAADDGRLGFGAFLFPFVDGVRVVPYGSPTPTDRFRYLLVRSEHDQAVVEDLGWQDDEWDQWAHVRVPSDLLRDS